MLQLIVYYNELRSAYDNERLSIWNYGMYRSRWSYCILYVGYLFERKMFDFYDSYECNGRACFFIAHCDQ